MVRHRSLRLVVATTMVLCARCAVTAESWPADPPAVSDKVRQLMQDRNYSEAVKAIDEAAAAKDAPKDYLAYLKGQALYLQKQYDPAIAALDRMATDFPKSQWLRRARFSKAMALARKGDFRAAELIFRAEAEYLLSDERKQQVADIYLEYADPLFKPRKDSEKPDYAKAMEFFEKALEVGPKAAKRIEVELLVARCRQELQQYGEAISRYEKFIKAHPEHSLDIEARYRLGECRLAEHNAKLARRAWQDLLAKYVDARSERVADAQYQLSRTWSIPKPQSDEDLSLGVAALQTFVERFPTHKLAARAQLDIAESFIERGRHEDAVAALRQFLANPRYKDRDEIPTAREMLGRCYQLQKKYVEAIEAWREYLVKHPTHKEWSSVQRAIVDTEYLMASEKIEAKQYDAGNRLFAEFMAKYPIDARIPGILLMINRRAVAEGKWDEAIAAWRRIVSKYPESDEASQAQFSIAETLETKLGKLEEALEEYRKVTWGASANSAQQAIARLTASSMTVATERIFRSDETPRLKLVTRNIESVTVRAYKVDLETYFRKMHLARDVEGLDIALIDPDRTFKFKVPKYAKHQQLESEIEAPLPGGGRSGVMAVTVSSKTREATTMVLQSDLDVIVKSSRNEVFVFAENMLTGKPWTGVRLLLSNGKQVFAEGATGRDGVFQKSYKDLKDAADVRVLAVSDGHVASSNINLHGVGIAKGLSDRGYIYTDRPAYRPAQMVHIRGCVRRAIDDAYRIENGRKYSLEIFDNRNRLLSQQTVKLGEFGSFHAQFELPANASLGQYRVALHDDGAQKYQGGFLVEQYRLESVRLIVDAPRDVYYRGEEIEGTIRAAFYYGAPLAGREIRYQLADDRQYTATTDAKGEVRFKLPTREFSESQLLALKVQLPERNVATERQFMLSAQGFSIAVRTIRPVFVAGETFEATVNTRDAEGKPTGQKLVLKVLERTTVNGKVGERLVSEHPLTTADDGSARKTLNVEKGGDYVLRVEGTDRFKNPISGECRLQISGDEDKVRLRILADRHTYKVGDTAAIKVHWRQSPALALVTFQGARVLDYKLVELKPGVNELSIPMTAALVPNFDLSVAVMTDAERSRSSGAKATVTARDSAATPIVRFHEASSPFSVSRDLRVKIVAQRKRMEPTAGKNTAGPSLAPGENIELAITTTDPQGKPVAAELSLAMIEQSLLDRFKGNIAAIQDFFQAERREPAVRSTSSITFAYHPQTHPINPRLLAEEERLAVAAEEESSRMQAIERLRSDQQIKAQQDMAAAMEKAGLDQARKPKGAMGGTGIARELRAKSRELSESLGRPAAVQPEAGAPPVVTETAYWNPAVVTGKDGKAIVSLSLPQRCSAWRLLAKGITVDTLAGEADEPLVVKKDFFGELKLPQSFTDGDEAEIIASIHNEAIEKGPIEVTFKTSVGGRSSEQKKTLQVDAKGIREVAFKVRLDAAAGEKLRGARTTAEFALAVSAADRRDVAHAAVPLLPYGMPVYATASGVAASDTTAWVEPPAGMNFREPSLTILVGPTVERSLLDVLLAPPPECQIDVGQIASDVEVATSDLMAAIGLQSQLSAARDSGPLAQSLDARIRAALGTLLSAQNEEGGWAWTATGGASERWATSRALWALSLARKAGYHVPDGQLRKAIVRVQYQVTVAAEDDYETKSIGLHALSTVAEADFALANRLYRQRQRLSAGALLYLSLAMAEMDRKPTAAELLDLVASRKIDEAAARRTAEPGSSPWNQSPAELRGLWALALERAAPQSAKLKQLVDWLLAHRVGYRWSPDKATGPVTLALCQWFAKSRFDGDRYTLKILVNDKPAKTLEVDPAAGTQAIDVPPQLLAPDGKQRIAFQIAGRGRYAYQCFLSGFAPADEVRGTTKNWSVRRTYEPAPLEVDGRDIPRGFSILQGSYTTFRNPLGQLPVGKRGLVELNVWRANLSSSVPDDQLEYLVVTEPLPSGSSVIEKSVRGGFERFELSPGQITFYVGNRRHVEPIHYEVYGYLPGAYRAAPTVVRSAYRPEQWAVATAKPLTVLPSGEKSSDPYRLTPEELLALGNVAYTKGDLRAAGPHLAELLKNWNVTSSVYKEAVQMLLDVHLRLGPPAEVVRYFEIVKEKWPNEEIPFAKILKVAAAYHDMGEFERSYLVFRATVEGSFLRDSGVAGFLEAQGQFARGVDVMGQLLRDYPPESYVAAATYALAQHVFAKAPEAANDPQLRKQKINRVDLVRRAWTMLESFLTAYPDDPAADQAAFASATALLDLKAYRQAAAACDRYAKRYPKSQLMDAFWYMIGYCHFANGEHEAALEMCRKVAETKRVDPATGREEESRNKWQAVYILGQVYHSLGKAAEAIREYRRVEDKFPDAKQSIDYFTRKAIALPEVVAVKPGDAAGVELKFRNVGGCDLKVYRIDLMKFSLIKRDLSGITQINLSGIRPQHEESIALGDGKDYRDRTHKLSLPLKQEGAYLIVCRGDDLYATGLALVTPLTIDVQTDAVSGRVRATVKDRASDKYLPNIHVKVIGSGNEDFVSGQTDLRGVFVADGIRGSVTVIAQSGPSHYAFYRAREIALPLRQMIAAQPRTAHAASVAQEETSRASVPTREPTEKEKKIAAALKLPTEMDFTDTPLSDVILYLSDYHGIAIQLDRRALTEAGVETSTPVTQSLKGIDLRSALRLMLRELNLTYVVQDSVLLITTPEEAEARLETRIYPVADLVIPEGTAENAAADSSEGAQADFDSLVEVITTTVRPTTWDCVGGPGSIKPFENNLTLVFSQTQDVHEEIEDLLQQLRKVKRETGKTALPRVAPGKRTKQFGGMFMGGMGGMGGGMGGMQATFGGGLPARSRRAGAAGSAAAASQQADLLRGVQDMNRGFQGEQSQKLNKMYKQSGGMGGIGAGAAF